MDRSSGTEPILPPESHTGLRLGRYYFPAYVTYAHASGHRLCLNARCHRKGKPPHCADAATCKRAPIPYWAPQRLGWWIAVLFMIGSLCFAVGAWAASFPRLTPAPLLSAALQNAVFFTGSLFFTSAATCQLVEARLALRRTVVRVHTPEALLQLPERFARLGYVSALTQWIGTLLFNANTFDAMLGGGWLLREFSVWTPDMIGSILFLASSHFAYLEIRYDRNPSPLSRVIVLINYLGAAAFMLSALFAVVLPTPEPPAAWAASFFTLAGALCFFAGAYLLLPELGES